MSCSSPKVLFIVLGEELIGIDFEQLLRQPQWTPQVPVPNCAPIYFKKSLMDLFKDRKEVIVGLTHITLGSNVYLIGGERLKSGARTNKRYVRAHPECYVGFSLKAFRLIKENTTFTVKPSPCMDLHYGKCTPMIANIGPKVYVVGGPSYLHNHNPKGTFEVYYPDEKYWQIVMDPPPYLSDPEGQVLGHFVLGHRLFVVSNSGQAYSFDTIGRDGWKLAPNVLSSFKDVGLSLPINGISVPFFPELSNDFQLVVSRDGLEDAHALIIYAPMGSLMFYQSLREVFHGRCPFMETGDRVRLSGGRNFFFLLPYNRICAMWVAFDHYKRLRLFITIFALQLCYNPVAGASSSSAPFQHQGMTSLVAKQTMFLRPQITHTYDCIVRQDATTSSNQNHVFDAFLYQI